MEQLDQDLAEYLDTNFTDSYTEYNVLMNPNVKTIAVMVACAYVIAFSVGIPANIYVLFRMRRLASNDNERYRNGTGVALCSMAAADLCSLLLICAQNVHQMVGFEQPDTALMHGLCKGMLFLTHTVTAVSIWSWLLLSSLRYLAICHPLYHLRLWQMPYRALAFIISMSCLLNFWLLIAVHSTTEGCTQVPLLRNSLSANRLFHLIEWIWSFCIPCLCIIVMDANVVAKSTLVAFPRIHIMTERKKSSGLEDIIKLTRKASIKIQMGQNLKHRHQRALWKWLLIALVCIILNAPENIYRLIALYSLSDEPEGDFDLASRMVSQALYFSQFAFNAIYLAVFVYDKSTRYNKCDTSTAHPSAHPAPMRSRVASTAGIDSPVRDSAVRLLQQEIFPKSNLVEL